MKCSTEPPPVYERAKELWGVTMESGVVFTYGDTCHVITGLLPDWLEAHEIVHTKQQTDPKAWWEKYFIDPQFRLEQELEAYKAQYKWIEKHIKDKNTRFKWLNKFATDLSSPMYGGIITKREAMNLIK